MTITRCTITPFKRWGALLSSVTMTGGFIAETRGTEGSVCSAGGRWQQGLKTKPVLSLFYTGAACVEGSKQEKGSEERVNEKAPDITRNINAQPTKKPWMCVRWGFGCDVSILSAWSGRGSTGRPAFHLWPPCQTTFASHLQSGRSSIHPPKAEASTCSNGNDTGTYPVFVGLC
jgi:hypothetical protein